MSDAKALGGHGKRRRGPIAVTLAALGAVLILLSIPGAIPNHRTPTSPGAFAMSSTPPSGGPAVAIHRSSAAAAGFVPADRTGAASMVGVSLTGSTIGNPPCPTNSTWSTPGYWNWTSSVCFTTSYGANGSLIYCLWTFNTTAGIWNSSCFVIANSLFGTPCALLPANVTIGSYGVNLSVLSTPANGTGPGPMNFTWNASVSDGGLPPYIYVVYIESATYSMLSTNRTGAVTLSGLGLYEVNVMAFDSTCTQSAFVSFPLQVYGSLGPNPVSISASATSSTVPSNVTYSVNTSLLPANWSVAWETPGIFSSPSGGYSGNNSSWNAVSQANYTYYFPGNYSATACFVDPNGDFYACGSSPTIRLGGPSPITTNVTIGSGPFPVAVTFNVTLSNSSVFPAGTYLYLYSRDLRGVGVENLSNSSSVNLTISAACGYPWTPAPTPSGSCEWPAVFSVNGLHGGPDAGFFGGVRLVANLTANGSPASWYPALSVTYGPLNGTLPLNFTLNFSVAGGTAPYQWSYSVLGRSSGAANASFYAPVGANGWGWNGSTIRAVVPLNTTGIYWAQVFVADARTNWAGFAVPLIVLGNVSPFSPLHVRAHGGGGSVVAGTSTGFMAQADGGKAPFAVQWAFGDGQFGSSLLGATITHVYPLPGTYYPTVTVTDAAGESVLTALPPVVVTAGTTGPHSTNPSGAAPASSHPGPGNAPMVSWVPLLLAAIVAGVLICAGALGALRDIRREGEELVAAVERAPPPVETLPETPIR